MIAEIQGNAKPVEAFQALAEVLTGRSEMRKGKRSALGPLLERFSLKKKN